MNNKIRRRLGSQALRNFQKEVGSHPTGARLNKLDLDTDAVDLIADILHVCNAHNLDTHSIVRRAQGHVEIETQKEG